MLKNHRYADAIYKTLKAYHSYNLLKLAVKRLILRFKRLK